MQQRKIINVVFTLTALLLLSFGCVTHLYVLLISRHGAINIKDLEQPYTFKPYRGLGFTDCVTFCKLCKTAERLHRMLNRIVAVQECDATNVH